ncbi:MAG: DUF1592 domain-containing protein [Holophagales bacterium]|nr:DUF1592 domain-containing protein [Holophagales bacterium]MYF06082.1 DUF1592 domain-containing protein [Holophagales bacterium]
MHQPPLSLRRRQRAIRVASVCACWFLAVVATVAAGPPAAPAAAPAFDADAPHRALISRHCLGCHNARLKTAGLELDALVEQHETLDRATWEKVARKLRARQMPPPGRRRPDESAYREALSSLEGELDRIAVDQPDPGRTETFRRLNRTEYHNAVRDLLALEVDVASLLPADSASFGFDNVTVGDLSPTLLERYVGAAEKISRLAVGRSYAEPVGITFRTDPDLTQEKHVEGLPIGTRGGLLATWNFPADGVYEFSIRLARDRNEHVEGLREPHDLELLIDRERVETFTVAPPDLMSDVALNYQPSQDDVDDHLVVRVPVTAGPHDVGVTFPARPWVLLETARQPYESHFNYYRHPRVQPAIFSVSIVGPYLPLGAGDTPSRQRIFVCQPENVAEEDPCAREILANVMRRAYRRPVTGEDVRGPFALYEQARAEDGFEAGIEMGLAAVLVSPEFLFRIERDPAGVEPGAPYRVSDVELASRLAFFLWSSIPDDELLELASAGRLSEPDVLEQQVERMLADPRAENLVTNFAAQWLHLRNLDGVTPDKRLFPDFDDNLRQAMRRETELFVGSILREDRSALDLVQADYTFLNERLAKHYGIPHVYGSRFRRVELDDDSVRGGLLRHGSILTVTSFATRTSPVVRGNWVLGNLLGVPPPPPPPDVPDLPEAKIVAKELPMRERLSAHRDNPACSGCHRLMDPVGFALENYDAIGRWRTVDAGFPIDASGELWDGTALGGVRELESAMLARPELFLTTLTEKLLVFGTGRGVTATDAPAVRAILRRAETDDYRLSSLIQAVVASDPFQMRRASS